MLPVDSLGLMSASVDSTVANPDSKHGSNEALGQAQPARAVAHKNYKGFVAGVFSGISKLSGRYTGTPHGRARAKWKYSRSPLRYDQGPAPDLGKVTI